MLRAKPGAAVPEAGARDKGQGPSALSHPLPSLPGDSQDTEAQRRPRRRSPALSGARGHGPRSPACVQSSGFPRASPLVLHPEDAGSRLRSCGVWSQSAANSSRFLFKTARSTPSPPSFMGSPLCHHQSPKGQLIRFSVGSSWLLFQAFPEGEPEARARLGEAGRPPSSVAPLPRSPPRSIATACGTLTQCRRGSALQKSAMSAQYLDLY